MKLSFFNYELPNKQIAQYPATKREDARLMVIDRETGIIEHKKFYNVLDYFEDKDSFVVNNSTVFPARMFGKKEKTGAKIDVFLQRELSKKTFLWDAIVEPARKIRVGNKLFFGKDGELIAEIVDNTTSRGRTLKFLWSEDYDSFKAKLSALASIPLAPHIKRKVEPSDYDRSFSVFGKIEGSVVPTSAGLHFTRELVKYLEIKGIRFAPITVHNGIGTFKEIDIEDLNKNKIDAEYYNISEESADIVNKSIREKKRICAVGCSVLKAMESSYSSQNFLVAKEAWTNLYIFPPHQMHISTALITNFHPPKTCMFTNVAAFGGYDLIKKAYDIAIKEKYNFYTYGDAMLIL